MALFSNENWYCCLALYSNVPFKQCSEVNQTFLYLILISAIPLCYNNIANLLQSKTQQYQPPNYKYIKYNLNI